MKKTGTIIIGFRISLTMYVSMSFLACAPLPMIQSARVTGKAGIGAS